MREQLIEFETAKLAKEKGFKEPVADYYLEGGVLLESFEACDTYSESYYVDKTDLLENFNDNWKRTLGGGSCIGCSDPKFKESFSAPTQSLLQKWLREEHNVSVIVGHCLKSGHTLEFEVLVYDVNEWSQKDYRMFKTYELALEKGLFEALKLI